jgi:single-strand DNA-binding protein
MSLNKVMIIGNLGADPDARATNSGGQVVNLRVAVSDHKGETEWFRVVTFKNTADFCAKYLHKGSKVFVEGRLKTNKWTDKDGNDRYTTELIAHNVQSLDKREQDNETRGDYQAPPSLDDSDIPF